MSALAAAPTSHAPKGCALPATAGHGDLGPRCSSCISILHLAIVQAGTEGFAHTLRVLLVVFHCE